jgi:hypothetical protein
MKKISTIILGSILIFSCKPNYKNQVKNTLQSSVYKQGFLVHMITPNEFETDSVTLDSIKKGYVDTTRIGVEYYGNTQFVSYAFTHKILRIAKTGYQNWTDFWHTSWRIITAFIGLIAVIWSLWTYIKKTSAGGGLSNMARIVPLFIGLVMLGCSIYPWSSEGYISAAQYDVNQAKDGDQRSIDWNNIKGL